MFESRESAAEWTSLEDEAAKDKNKPRLFSRKGAGDKGTPAAINHGNIPPSIDGEAGGVTMSHAVHTVVLSLAGLRRLRFQTRTDGTRFSPEDRDRAETAARTALAALALAGIVRQRDNGYDLRSRSLLVASEPLTFELLHRDGGEPTRFVVADPAALLKEAADAAQVAGLSWETSPVRLKPTPKLAHLIVESRKLKAAGDSEDQGAE